MNESRLTTIASFSFPHEAQLAKTSLDAAGIPAFIADENTINMQWLYSNALGGVKLQVPFQFAEKATEILSQDLSAQTEEECGKNEITCQKCGRCIAVCPSGTIKQGQKGFRVQLGGRLGRHPRLGMELPGILKPEQVLEVLRLEGSYLFPLEVEAMVVPSAGPAFWSQQPHYRLGFPRYRVFFYNEGDLSVEVSLYAYLTG